MAWAPWWEQASISVSARLSKRDAPGYEAISQPATEVVDLLRQLKTTAGRPIAAAEIGVGIGASTIEFVRELGAEDELHLFDRDPVLTEVLTEIEAVRTASGVTVVPHGNEAKLLASYAWEIATMLRRLDRRRKSTEIFDFVYLDGAHAFHHDAAACSLLMRMIRPGGYLVVDDMNWTFNSSPTLNPTKRPDIGAQFTDEQLSTPHVALVVDVLVRHDPRFVEVTTSTRKRPRRAVFRRLSRAEMIRRALRWRLARLRRKAIGR